MAEVAQNAWQQLGEFGTLPGSQWSKKRQKVTEQMVKMSSERFLDPSKVCSLIRMTHTDPAIRAMIDLIARSILKHGVILREMTEMFKGARKEKFYQFIDAEYRPFLISCLYCMFAVGFCAYTWKPHAEFVGKPACLDLETVRVGVSKNCLGEVQLKYYPLDSFSLFGPRKQETYDRKDGLKRREPEILTYFITAPTLNAEIRSHMTALIDDVMLNDFKRQCALQAEFSLARPTVFISKKEQKPDDLKQLGETIVNNITNRCPNNPYERRGTSNFGDPAVDLARSVSATMARVVSRGVPAATAKAALSSPGGGPGWHNSDFVNVERVKDGFGVESSVPRPQAPDLARWRSEYEERASFLFGVPKMLWSNSNPSRKHKILASGGEDSADKILSTTVRFWSAVLSTICARSYEEMYREHHKMLRAMQMTGEISERQTRLKHTPKPFRAESKSGVKERSALELVAEASESSGLISKDLRSKRDSPAKEGGGDDEEDTDYGVTLEYESSNSGKRKFKWKGSSSRKRLKVLSETRLVKAANTTRTASSSSSSKSQKAVVPSSGNPGKGAATAYRLGDGKRLLEGDEDSGVEGDDEKEEHGTAFWFMKSISAEFSFPGVIDMRNVETVYNRGLMKHSVYRSYVNREYGIPLEDIEESPIESPILPESAGPGPSRVNPADKRKKARQKERPTRSAPSPSSGSESDSSSSSSDTSSESERGKVNSRAPNKKKKPRKPR